MQWLTDLLPFADKPVVQIGFLAACGIAALVVLAILYRFVFAHRLRVPGGRTRQPRLGLVDAFSLDGQRQLVLVRRDNVEHLIMIGGPNDVLVESQINRALAAARESTLAPVAQAPHAPTRRTESVAVAPPAPVAAPAAVAPPPAANAKAAPQQPQPAVSATTVPTAEVRPIRSQPVSPGPTPPTPEVSPPPAPVRPAPVAQQAPPAAKAAEPTSAHNRPQPRALPARSAMPPPITPTAAPAARATVTRLPEKHLGAPPVQPGQTAAPLQTPEALGPSPSRGELPRQLSRPPTPTPIAPTVVKVAAPAEAPMIAKAELKIGPTPTLGDEPQAAPSPADKSAPKPEDPLGGLESLEAEMARLLGRE